MKTQDRTESRRINVDWQDLVAPVGKHKCLTCHKEFAILYNGRCLKHSKLNKGGAIITPLKDIY